MFSVVDRITIASNRLVYTLQSLTCWTFIVMARFSPLADIVVSSTYFHKFASVTVRSFIIIAKSHGPNFVR